MNAVDWNTEHPAGYVFHYADGSTFTVPSDPTTPIQQIKGYPELDTGTSATSAFHTSYDALQASLKKTLSHGVQFQAGYTRTRLLGNVGYYQDEWINMATYNNPLPFQGPHHAFSETTSSNFRVTT